MLRSATSIRSPQLRMAEVIRIAERFDVRPSRGRVIGLPHRGVFVPHERESMLHRRLRAIAQKLANDLDEPNSGQTAHIAGVAFLLAGDAKKAVKRLERAAVIAPEQASVWTDLAAARLALYDSEYDALQVVDALGDVDQALRIEPNCAEALFNRAQVFEVMGLHAAASDAWRRFIVSDDPSGWSREAAGRQRRLETVTRADEWQVTVTQLRAAVAGNDRVTVRRIVAAFPQDARANGEGTFLEEWAQAIRREDHIAAESALRLTEVVAEELMQINGETLLRDAVASIRAVERPEAIALIAEGQTAYVAARKLYATQKRAVSDALPLFEQATRAFGDHCLPMARVSEFYVASSLYDLNRRNEALQMLQRLERRVPRRHRALQAYINWQIGALYLREQKFQEALDAQSRATAIFEQLGEDRNANIMGSAAAATQAVIGRRTQAWKTRLAIFGRISRSGSREDLQRALDVAARAEALSGEWRNAHSLLTLAIDPRLNQNQRIYVSSLIWHAISAFRLDIGDVVGYDMASARAVAQQIRDPLVRTQALNDVLFCDAVTSVEEPHRAIALLDRYITAARNDASFLMVAEALLERGRARLKVGDDGGAIADFRAALDQDQKASRTLSAIQLRDAFFRTGEVAAGELASVLSRSGRYGEAFSIIDEERARAFLDGAESGAGVILSLSSDTMIVEYVSLPDELLVFILRRGVLRFVRVAVGAKSLEEMSARFIQELEAGCTPTALARLSEVLIGPIDADVRQTGRLIVVPDRTIMNVPFSALSLRSMKRLVEQVDLTIAPSAAVAAERRQTWRTVPQSLLAIGNPTIDRSRFPVLDPLPAAEREAYRIAREYVEATVLVRSAATREAVLKAIGENEVIHIAAHAVLMRPDPAHSHLVLAPSDSDSGVLYLADIERRMLRSSRLVFLAACETATTPDIRRNVDTLALAFIASGASNVVGTLWRVDDEITEEFAVLLHRELRRGATAAGAVRRAQLTMLKSSSLQSRSLSAWAAFQVYGSGQ